MNENILNIMISVIFGITLGIILYNVYICPSTVKGPNSKNIIDKIFEVNNKYYKLEPKVCECIKLDKK